MANLKLVDWNDISDEYGDTLVLGNGASISINSSFNYKSLFSVAVSEGLITPKIQQIFEHFDTQDFEYVLQIIMNAHDVNLALEIEDNTTKEVYELIQNSLIQVVKKIHVSHDDVVPFFPNIVNFLEQFDTIVSLNYDLILYWSILWANDQNIDTYFKDCFIKGGKFENDWHWLRKPIGGRDSTLIFYPHGNLSLAVTPNGETTKISREVKLIEIEGEILPIKSGFDLLASIQSAWIEDRYVPLFVSEGVSMHKLRAIQRNSYLNVVYESVLPEIRETIAIYGWSMSENDDHILSKLVSGNLQKIAVSIYKTDDWEDKAFTMRQKILKVYKQKHLDPPETIDFYDSSSNGCWKN